jgi:hypothetical protein
MTRGSGLVRGFAWPMVAGAMLIVLAGCGMVGEDTAALVVAPGKFDYYSCEELARTRVTLNEREQELSELMAKAAQSPMGEFVGAVSYKTELTQARGQLKQIAVVAERKNCALDSKRKSDRALF